MTWRSVTAYLMALVVLFFLLGAYGSYCYLDRVHEDRDMLLKENTEGLMGYIRRDQRIEDMTDVLTQSYDIDSLRAHYYSVLFDDMSRKYGIDWEWYAAIMRMESNFVATAKSKSRPPAKGIMQVKESTLRAMCDSLGIDYSPDTTVWDDISNILCGSHYFSLHAKKKGPEHGVKVYLGGRDYMRTIKANQENGQYVKEYNSYTAREYRRLKMAYEGVRAVKRRSGGDGRPVIAEKGAHP